MSEILRKRLQIGRRRNKKSNLRRCRDPKGSKLDLGGKIIKIKKFELMVGIFSKD